MGTHFSFDYQLEQLGTKFMSVNGLSCTFNLPPAEVSEHVGGEEVAHKLPPYAERTAFSVDDFGHACPANWVRGSDKDASFFVPVREGRGVWLDFNRNSANRRHVAIVVSIQGVNAVTNQPTEGRFHLEQYKTNCPRHNIPFGEGRHCSHPECGYKWPAQNYLATTGTPEGLFWLDGFRTADGTVRQFIFTEEVMRGIAAQVIGKDRVFSIGLAFFRSKSDKPVRLMSRQTSGGSCGLLSFNSSAKGGQPVGGDYQGSFLGGDDALEAVGSLGGDFDEDTEDYLGGGLLGGDMRGPVTPQKKLEIGAGARINQQVYPDPERIEFWEPEPAGFIYINYVDEGTARTILTRGRQDRTAGGEGPLARLMKGNPGVLPR